MADQIAKKSSPLMIALAWAIVIIPTAWGFNKTLQNAEKIFTAPAAPTNPASK
jgi:hypothetical protein